VGALGTLPPLSDARLEGLNSKIRLISHRAFGFHSADPLIADLSPLRRHHDRTAAMDFTPSRPKRRNAPVPGWAITLG